MAQAKKSKTTTVKSKSAKTARKALKAAAPAATVAKHRSGTKQSLMIELLSRNEGATIADLVAATSWLPHYADNRIMPMCGCRRLFSAGIAVSMSA